MATYAKGPDAPESFRPHDPESDVAEGDVFDEEYSESDERALICAGWIVPAEKKKGAK